MEVLLRETRTKESIIVAEKLYYNNPRMMAIIRFKRAAAMLRKERGNE